MKIQSCGYDNPSLRGDKHQKCSYRHSYGVKMPENTWAMKI
ncbi:hypothetical protein [Phocaeicola sp.]